MALGVSQFANSRQRLSIQSLLLQSDFVDDSHDIAAPSSSSENNNNNNNNNNSNVSQQQHHQQQQQQQQHGIGVGSTGGNGVAIRPQHAGGGGSSRESPSFSSSRATPTTTSSAAGAEAAWNTSSAAAVSQSHAYLTSAGAVNDSVVSAVGMHDESEQQRGLAFNPWMGFPGTEDLLSGGLNNDY